MFNFKTFNNIAEDGLNILHKNNFKEVSKNPDGMLLRSHNLANEDLDSNLLCIARAGAGTNNIPIRCLLYTSPSPRDATLSRMPSSA